MLLRARSFVAWLQYQLLRVLAVVFGAAALLAAPAFKVRVSPQSHKTTMLLGSQSLAASLQHQLLRLKSPSYLAPQLCWLCSLARIELEFETGGASPAPTKNVLLMTDTRL